MNEDLNVNFYKQGGRWVIDIVYEDAALSLSSDEAMQVMGQLMTAMKKITELEEV